MRARQQIYSATPRYRSSRWTVLVGVIAAILIHSGQSEEPSSKKVLRYAYSTRLFRDVDRKDAEVSLQVWTKDISARTGNGYDAEVKVYDDLAALAKDIRANAVDIVTMLAPDYLDLKEKDLLEPALAGTAAGHFPEEFVLLVHRDGKVTKMDQLRGKRFLLEVGGRGKCGRMWIDTLLMKEGLPRSQEFFKSIQETDKEQRAVFPVFFQQADACVVRAIAFETMAELNPQVKDRLQVLVKSPGFVLGFVCLRKDLTPEIKQDIINSGLTMHENPRGRQLLTFFRMDKIVLFKSGYLDALIALRKEYYDLLARSEGKK